MNIKLKTKIIFISLCLLLFISNYKVRAYNIWDTYRNEKEKFEELIKNSCSKFPKYRLIHKHYKTEYEAKNAPKSFKYVPDEGGGLFSGILYKTKIQYIGGGEYVVIYEGYTCLQ
ncbi:hypothetical protein [Helcococcus ovis]|uniref:hypothetical protein n=1 Tax=Helcococcus ovis TaxID=72026 RepID=UPI0038BB6280